MANKYKWDSSNTPPQDSKWGSGDSLGTKIEKMFTRFVQRVFIWMIDFVSDRMVDIFDNSMKILRPGMDRATAGMFPHLKQIKGMPAFFYQMMEAIEKEQGETAFFTKLIVMYATVRGIIFGGLQPYQDLANQWALNNIRTFLPDPQTASMLLRMGLLPEQGYKNIMGGLGVPDPIQEMYRELSRNLPSMGELFNGLWRDKYSKADFAEYAKRMGYNQKDTDVLLELTNNLPPLNDLIHMLVRDAFNDGAASQYGYDEDFPTEINEFFSKQGYNPDWAKRYWRSHWQLPSPTQGYEMLHRKLITIDQLDTLLRISDYPPFWRDKLRDISYNVMTRVDVRRLLQAGLIDEAKTEQIYNQMGYTPEDAKLLTEFAARGITQEERDLTKTEILNLYEEGLTDRGGTADNLVKMGYDQDEAEKILKLSDVNIAKAARADLINYTKERFLAHTIEENNARSELTSYGLKAQSVDRYMLNWQRATEVEAALPSMADAKRWFTGDYIDETKYRAILAMHKHTRDNIEIYVKEILDNKAAEAASETPTG